MTHLKSYSIIVSLLFCIFLNTNVVAHNPALSFDNIGEDYKAFYSKDRLLRLGGAFVLMGIVANTNADQQIHDWYRTDVESHRTNGFSPYVKEFGEKKYVVPASLGLSYYQSYDSTNSLANFGANTARAYVVGAPAMLAMQRVTGGSRPDETNRYANKKASQWRFMHDNNGVSGHSFMGAVPFLTLAKMNQDNEPLRIALLIASTLTAWSRVNDGDHYFSQAVLGWYIAYESVDAVFDVNHAHDEANKTQLTVDPMLLQIGITKRW